MLISLDWLKQYVDINETTAELDNALTMIGQEVEAIEEQGKYLNKVVIGELLEVGRHPEADKLTVCKVNVGKEILQIVCGATNHKVGDKVAAATDGAVLPGDFKIKKSKLRGVESAGMLCSAKELEIGEADDGIIILPQDAPVGEELKKYLAENDIIFELEITPNRPDCLSHIGIAREVAAYYKRSVKYPKVEIKESAEKTADLISINIKDETVCSRYAARVVKNVEIKESPEWLKKRLKAVGIRSINNIVDITNFVLMEYGHPLHAFDYDKISGKQINVRKAINEEKITTLDDAERTLDDSMIVIADGEKAVAMAGVMGAANSEVDTNTKTILLEVAVFDNKIIRKTVKKTGLSSDASYRFERGVDKEDAVTVINRAAALIQEVAGGEITSGIVDVYPVKYAERAIELDTEKLNKFIGKKVELEKVVAILESLELKVTKKDEKTLVIVPPSYRGDLLIKQDLYEEVIRMYGFENIEAKMPEQNIAQGTVAKEAADIDVIKVILTESGLQEVINYSFIPENAIEKLKLTDKVKTLKIMNPINEDMVVMRPTLIHSLLKNIGDNFSRNIYDIKIFEVSRAFLDIGEALPSEKVKIALAIGGKDNRNLWNSKPNGYDFYDIKGYVEEFFTKIGFEKYSLARTTNDIFHPGRAADIMVGKELIGTFGEVHPDINENYSLKERVYVAEFDMEKLLKYANSKIKYKRVIKYPAVERDIAVVLKEDVLVGSMLSDIAKADQNITESVDLFDVYKGEQVEAGYKSVAVNVTFRSADHTLTEEEVNTVMTKILGTIEKKYGGLLRK